MPKLRLLVHLGPMKTGTSAFAYHLSRQASAGTLPPSLIYPTGDLWFPARGEIVKHHDLVEVAPAPLNGAGERRRKTEATLRRLRERFSAIAAEAARRGGDVRVVMVCEIGDQRATPKLAKVLREYFDTVDFVIVARDQPSAIRSLLGQQIRMWDRTDVTALDSANFTRKHAARGSYDYARLWDKWNTDSADYSVHFVPYRSGGGADDLSQDIFTAAGFGDFPHSPELVNGTRIHSTFSRKRMRDLAAIKRWAPRLALIPGARALNRRLFDFVVGRAHAEIERNSMRPSDSWTLSPAEHAFVNEEYRKSNNQFRHKMGAEGNNARWTEWFAQTLGPVS
jgi:hypothetical protein